MKEKFLLESPDLDVRLYSIQESDCENLRRWKNAHRAAFFYQGIITPDQQLDWFRKYHDRADDFMFIVFAQDHAIGCMGFRMIDGRADIYNVILGEAEYGGKGWMSQAIQLLCSFIYTEFSHLIVAQVITHNPALTWYRKNGFREIATRENYVEIELDLARFCPCAFHKTAQVR